MRAFAGSRWAISVTTYFYLNCGHCRWCLQNLEPLCEHSGGQVGIDCDGAYAEYVKLPERDFIRLPDGIDYKKHPAEIGVVTDALATPYKVLRRARVKAGETVAVIGAGGGLGIHQLMMAKWARTRVIAIDTRASKFEACTARARASGGGRGQGRVAEQLLELTQGQGVDVVVDYVSATSTLEAGARALGRRGRLVTLGGSGKPLHIGGRHAEQGAGPVGQPLRDAERNRRVARSGRARRGVSAGDGACARWRRPRRCTTSSSAAR